MKKFVKKKKLNRYPHKLIITFLLNNHFKDKIPNLEILIRAKTNRIMDKGKII